MNRSEAKNNGQTRYIGLPCRRHPDDGGVRMTANGTCAQCNAIAAAEYKRRNPAKRREWAKKFRERHPERVAAWDARKRTDPKKRAGYLAAQRRYYRETGKLKNSGRYAKRKQTPGYASDQLARKKAWRAKNRERHLATSRAYDAKQLRENIQRRLSRNLRHRLSKAVVGATRGASAVRDLGLTITEFKSYIESQFAPGMTWANYGRWHLDHKMPLVSFDLSDPEQAAKACHYSNVQPLWAADNQRKGARISHLTTPHAV